MNKTDIAKNAIGLVVGSGVSRIVSGIIANNVPTETKYQKVIVFAGRVGIAMAAGAIVRKHTDAQVDEVVTAYNQVMITIHEGK